MRQIRYNKKDKYLAEEEGPKKKKRINWDRMVYLAILFAILGSLLFYLIKNFYFISAPGLVVKESYAVLLPYDIRIDQLYVAEDDSVTSGDDLLAFERDFRIDDNTLINSTRSVDEWITKERFSANRNIRVKTVEIEENNKRIEKIEEQIAKLEKLVILDVSGANRIEQYEMEIVGLNSQNRILQEEIKYWRGYLADLPRYKEEYQSTLLEQLNANSAVTVFKAPISGRIANINYKQYDLVYKGDIILNIELQDEYVRAYIAQDEYGSIFEGDIVNVIFPDNKRSKGVIEKIYRNLEQLPPEYQDDTRSTVRRFLAIVRPLNEEEQEEWRLNNNLSVEIRKRRFF